jgi:hypothetical protein
MYKYIYKDNTRDSLKEKERPKMQCVVRMTDLFIFPQVKNKTMSSMSLFLNWGTVANSTLATD